MQTKPLSYAGPFFSFSRITFTLNVGTDRVNPCMCDQIWQNYATFGKIIPLLAKLCHFWQLLVRVYFGIIWQNLSLGKLANFLFYFIQVLLIAIGQILNKNHSHLITLILA